MKNTLKVGAGKADITPSKKILPIPFFFMFNMDEAIDPLHVRVLDIENGNDRVVFVTFDTTFVPNPAETVKYVCELTGLDESHVFIAATHNHCAPMVGVLTPDAQSNEKNSKIIAWYAEIKTALKAALDKAAADKRPAKMGFGTGKSYVNINRDEVNDEGKAVIGVNFERESDKTLSVVKFEDDHGKLIALLVNFAVHATVMNGCTIGSSIKITSDLPGVASSIVEEKQGGVCLWTSGAAGDQNPRFGTQFPEENTTDLTKVKNLGESGHLVLEYLAKEHAKDIINTQKKIVCKDDRLTITAQKMNASVEGRTPAAALMFAQLQGVTLPPPPDVDYTLRLITLGELAIEGISAEIVTSVGKVVRSVSPFKNTILITQTDEYRGYVPDDWEYDHNAFEAEGATVEKGAAQPAFVKGFKDMFGKI